MPNPHPTPTRLRRHADRAAARSRVAGPLALVPAAPAAGLDRLDAADLWFLAAMSFAIAAVAAGVAIVLALRLRSLAGRQGAAARQVEAEPAPPPVASHRDPLYGDETCREFAIGLSDEILPRALVMAQPLARLGQIDAPQLAGLLGARPSDLGGLVVRPLQRRATALGLPLPFVVSRRPRSGRRAWENHAGIAERLSRALEAELIARREGAPDDDPDRYAALTLELRRRETEDEVRLAFAEIAALVDGLPKSAMRSRSWWMNVRDIPGGAHASAWLDANRRAYPDLAAGEVLFLRRSAVPASAIPIV
jgi:hypothetical protein